MADEDLTVDLLNSTRRTINNEKLINQHAKARPLLDKLWGAKKTKDWGTGAELRVSKSFPGTLRWYSGRNAAGGDVKNIVTVGFLPKRKAAYDIEIEGDKTIENVGTGRVIDLARETMEGGVEGVLDDFEAAIITGDGSGDNPHGLPAIVGATADAVYADIDPTTDNPYWRAVHADAESGPITLEKIDEMYYKLDENGALPRYAFLSRRNYTDVARFIRPNITHETPGNQKSINLGNPKNIWYGTMEFILHPKMPNTRMFTLDLRSLHIGVSRDKSRWLSFAPWNWRIHEHDEDFFRSKALFAGNIFCEKRWHQGVMNNIVPDAA